MHENSILTFTIERSKNNCLPYLDVFVEQTPALFKTKIYTKETNAGRCLNARGDCSEMYKRSVVSAYARRALTHCSCWEEVDREFNRIRQLLTNNGFPDVMIEEGIRKELNKYFVKQEKINTTGKIIIYHHLTYGSKFKKETEAVTKIIKRGVNPLEPFDDVIVRTYSRPNYTSALLMRNNTAPKPEHNEETNVVYQFVCSDDACRQRKVDYYIGLTSQTLRKRMGGHRYKGAIHDHFKNKHDGRPNMEVLLNNMKIINKTLKKILHIAEAVAIEIRKPLLNVQKRV